MKFRYKNFVEKIINLLLNILIFVFGIILLISLYTGVQTKILGNDYTNFFGFSIFEVQTGSMAEAINPGDWIIVKLTQNVKLNDVVTYELNGEFVTHRIIEAYKGTFITKGDANNAKDEPIDQKQIVGKVVNVLANFGIFRKTLFNPSVLIALIVTLFLFNFAFKKNNHENIKRKNGHISFDNIVDKAYSLFNFIVKKIYLIYRTVKNKIRLLTKKLKEEEKIDETRKAIVNQNISEIINKNLKSNERAFVSNNVEKTTSNEEDYYTDEDELDKTSFYRVIPVDVGEVDERFSALPTKEELDNYYTDEDDLDKTSLYRIIPVDVTEVDNTLLEIAENEIKEDKQSNENVTKKVLKSEKEETIEEESLTKINLDLLKNKKKNRKINTLIDNAIFFKEEELAELLDIIVLDAKKSGKEVTIKNKFINTYTDAKYYDYYGLKRIDYNGKNLTIKIEKLIKEIADELIKNYHGNDNKYKEAVEKYANAFALITNLEKAKNAITDSKAKNEFYKKEILKYYKDLNNQKLKQTISEIMKVQKKYTDILEYFLKNLETNMFDLNFNKLTTNKNMYGLELKHNISFSKVYSEYIIDKTYNEGIVAEDKMSVLLTLLSGQLIRDMVSADFEKKYILYIPNTLYGKERKFEKLLKMLDVKYAKDRVIILTTFEDLLNNLQVIKRVRKNGHKFAIVFDKDMVIKVKDRGNVYVADYIFINKKAINAANILSFIPKELVDNVIYENIVDKIGDFGGE